MYINYNFKLILIALFASLAFSSCNKYSKLEEAVNESIGKHIDIPTPFDSLSNKFTILRYLERPNCTSCQLQLGKWNVYNRRLKKTYGEEIAILFIINTENVSETKRLLKIYGFDSNSIISDNNSFITNNELSPILGKDLVMLLDSHNKILCFGNPLENIKIDSIYHSFFNKIPPIKQKI